VRCRCRPPIPGKPVGPESSDKLMTSPKNNHATLHERVERDKAFKPTESSGTGSVRLASLVAAAKANAPTRRPK
jgi:hypothetical protein